MENIIEVKRLNFGYSKKELTIKDVSFDIVSGSFHAFIGENGAGKSTIIKIIVGLIDTYEGEVNIEGFNAKRSIYSRKWISYIPDKAIFPHNISTFKYLMNCALLKRDDKENIKSEILSWAKELEIDEVMKRNPNKLSSGQKKKVFIIRAIIEQARIIILDEPAANLDPTSRIQLFRILKYLSEMGITIFISSHILDEIKNYANVATFIKKGQLIWSGYVEGNLIIDIYNNYYLGVSNYEVFEE